jgi:hypothetical protein
MPGHFMRLIVSQAFQSEHTHTHTQINKHTHIHTYMFCDSLISQKGNGLQSVLMKNTQLNLFCNINTYELVCSAKHMFTLHIEVWKWVQLCKHVEGTFWLVLLPTTCRLHWRFYQDLKFRIDFFAFSGTWKIKRSHIGGWKDFNFNVINLLSLVRLERTLPYGSLLDC